MHHYVTTSISTIECYGQIMINLFTRSLLVGALLSTASCYAEDPAPQYAGQGDDDGTGDLVEVSPGVEVVADYNEPVFFADDYYWVNRGGVWYSSTWYGGGWNVGRRPPERIVGVRNPGTYTHYRPAGYERHPSVRGGYTSHAQYHTAHRAGSAHVRAAVRGGGGGHHR